MKKLIILIVLAGLARISDAQIIIRCNEKYESSTRDHWTGPFLGTNVFKISEDMSTLKWYDESGSMLFSIVSFEETQKGAYVFFMEDGYGNDGWVFGVNTNNNQPDFPQGSVYLKSPVTNTKSIFKISGKTIK